MRSLLLSTLVILLFSTLDIYPQTPDIKIADKLEESDRESGIPLIAIKSTLPCNLFQPVSSSFIGISDTGTDSVTAYQQAFLRALSLAAYRHGKARGMSDYFNDTNRKQQYSNYEEFCELKASCDLPVEGLKVVRSFRLSSGELVLFLAIDSNAVKPEKRVNLKSSTVIYSKENEINGSLKIISKIMMENQSVLDSAENNHSEKVTYHISNNRWLSKEIFFDNKKIDTDRYKIYYNPSSECGSDLTDSLNAGTGTVDGLWHALLINAFGQLSAQLKEHFLKVKKVGDSYQDKMISLNRESGYFQFGFELVDVLSKDNKIYTRIKTGFPANP